MKTHAAHELMLQAWWDETLIYSDRFFDTTANIAGTEDDEMMKLYSELRMIRTSFQQADYPPLVMTARQYLLNSMAEVMLSLKAFFAGEPEVARFYMQTAQRELENLQSEVLRLGLGSIGGGQHLH